MLSFDLSEEQSLIKNMVEDFARKELSENARECDESGTIPDDLVKKAWELGLIMNNVPESYGGFGAERSILSQTLAAEGLAWGDVSFAMHILVPSLFIYPILDMGTDDQKQKYLPDVCGEEYKPATMAIMEPNPFFDVTSMNTKASLDGEEYVLNGRKCYVPLASKSGHILISANTLTGSGYSGIQGFIVKKGTMGMKIGEREKNMGLKALETNEITLKDVRVPKSAMLGGSNGSNFMRILNYSRIGLAAMAVGMARAAFEYARDYAKERHAFGEPIASRQAIAFMLAEMAIEIDATRIMLWEAAWKADRGEDCTKEAYLVKQYASDMVMSVTDRAVQVLGGHGYIREHPVEMWMRNARGFATLEGMTMM